jgi:hypothetical protein
MPIYARTSSKDFTPAPAGLQYAICCDVVDLGMVHSDKWDKTQHKVRLKWQSEEEMQNGKPFLISKDYTLSMHEKATLRLHIESWMGRKLTEEEAAEFDVEQMLDKVCQLNIVHVQGSKGGTFANIASIVPAGKRAPVMQVRDYERVCAREGYKPPQMDEPPPHSDIDMGQMPDEEPPF